MSISTPRLRTADEPSRTLTVEEAASLLGISRRLAYEQAAAGEIAGVPVLRVGRRLLVPRAPLERVLDGIDAGGGS